MILLTISKGFPKLLCTQEEIYLAQWLCMQRFPYTEFTHLREELMKSVPMCIVHIGQHTKTSNHSISTFQGIAILKDSTRLVRYGGSCTVWTIRNREEDVTFQRNAKTVTRHFLFSVSHPVPWRWLKTWQVLQVTKPLSKAVRTSVKRAIVGWLLCPIGLGIIRSRAHWSGSPLCLPLRTEQAHSTSW